MLEKAKTKIKLNEKCKKFINIDGAQCQRGRVMAKECREFTQKTVLQKWMNPTATLYTKQLNSAVFK